MSYPLRVSAGGANFTLVGETKLPDQAVKERVLSALLDSHLKLKAAILWVVGKLSQLGHEVRYWNDHDLVMKPKRARQLALLEYCFGPLPDDGAAFASMVKVIGTTLQQTLAGLVSPDLTITEETHPFALGHANTMEFFNQGFYIQFHDGRMIKTPELVMMTIIHEASHKFARTLDVLGDNSDVWSKWEFYWQSRKEGMNGTAHPRPGAERPRPGMGSGMLPPLTDHKQALLNADSYATFAAYLGTT